MSIITIKATDLANKLEEKMKVVEIFDVENIKNKLRTNGAPESVIAEPVDQITGWELHTANVLSHFNSMMTEAKSDPEILKLFEENAEEVIETFELLLSTYSTHISPIIKAFKPMKEEKVKKINKSMKP